MESRARTGALDIAFAETLSETAQQCHNAPLETTPTVVASIVQNGVWQLHFSRNATGIL
jgi:hypothetical protein